MRRCATTRRSIAGRSSIPENFWSALWDFCEVRAQTRRATQILEDGNRMPGAQWFIDARFNYAENLLRRDGDAPAIIFRNERGAASRDVVARSCVARVARIADGLRQRWRADQATASPATCRIFPKRLIAMLAATSLGAIWSSCSPDFGVSGVLDRFGQITPKVLFAADGYQYAGKTHRLHGDVSARSSEKIASIERVVLVPYLERATGARRDRRRRRCSQSSVAATRRCRSRNCRSIIRPSSCIPPARRACRSASCTAPAARCCSR